jgi:hypothetical protein
MMLRRYLIPATILSLALFSLPARADVVILKSGKKLNVEKVWQENGQTWIVFHGIRASIPQSKVERIESDSSSDPVKLDLKKEANVNLKKNARPTPQDSPGKQTEHASQTAATPQPTKIRKDQSRIFPDESFSDLKWGTKISTIKDLQKVQDPEGQDGVAEYRQKIEKLKFGQAALSSIHYAFWRDRLYMMTIRTTGRSNYTALRDEVFRQFGKGLRADQALEKFLWTASPNDILLQYSKDGQQGMLWLRSSEMDRQYKLAQVRGHASYLKWMKSRN